jgi:2-polyprenyl-3-methyl-5-hydroxy-6-metoxy-1,4-benzoquinol methylase
MSYDWKEFTISSDQRYREALHTGNKGELVVHNILSGGDVELGFIADVVRSHGHRPLPKGLALDVCCGSGYMSYCLARQGYRVQAFDTNADAVQLARINYPDIDFKVDDAASPRSTVTANCYDLILIREAHPFSRVRDDEFHRNLLRNYIALLKPNGVLAIGHSRRGGGMIYPSISYTAMKDTIAATGAVLYGPYFIFFYKYFRFIPSAKFFISVLSLASNVVSTITRRRWIEYAVIQRT